MQYYTCTFILAVDITVYHGGFHGDLNETMFVGKVDEASKKLVRTAYECMMKGIELGEPGHAVNVTCNPGHCSNYAFLFENYTYGT